MLINKILSRYLNAIALHRITTISNKISCPKCQNYVKEISELKLALKLLETQNAQLKHNISFYKAKNGGKSVLKEVKNPHIETIKGRSFP